MFDIVLVSGLDGAELHRMLAFDLGEVVGDLYVIFGERIALAVVVEHTGVATHPHGRQTPVVAHRDLREQRPRLKVGVLPGAHAGVHHPRPAHFVDRRGAEDVSLSGADVEVRVAVIRIAAVGARIARGGQIPWRALGPVEYAVYLVFGRKVRVHAVVDAVDTDLVRHRRNVIRPAIRQSRGSEVGRRRKVRKQCLRLRSDQVRRDLIVRERTSGERIVELRPISTCATGKLVAQGREVTIAHRHGGKRQRLSR